MANSSDEYWSIDGVSLHQYGWSVATVGGGRYDLPPLRGEDIRLAYRPGAVHRRKFADPRTVNLVMWVTGADPATGQATGDRRLRWNDSWDFLRRLVWKPLGGQVTLTRRWWLTVDGDPTLVAADGLAQIADTMAPTMTGRHRADFTMTLLMSDPYFYGDQVVVPLYQDLATVVSNPGHDLAACSNLQLELIGPLTNPRITNSTTAPNVYVTYTGDIPAGQVVQLDVPTFTANSLNNLATPTIPSTAAIQAHANGMYVSAANGGASPLIANAPTVGVWETFDIEIPSPGYIAFKARVNGKYVTAENAGAAELIANRDAIGPWETFSTSQNGDGTVSFNSLANDKWVTAENAGAAPLIANRNFIGPWEKFRFFDPAVHAGNVIGSVSHGGARHWMGLNPGDNTITLTADAGTGTAVLRFRPPYI